MLMLCITLGICVYVHVTQVIQTQDKVVYDAIQKALDMVNQEAVSNAAKVCCKQGSSSWFQMLFILVANVIFITAQVKKFFLLPQDFSIPGGELGVLAFCAFFEPVCLATCSFNRANP